MSARKRESQRIPAPGERVELAPRSQKGRTRIEHFGREYQVVEVRKVLCFGASRVRAMRVRSLAHDDHEHYERWIRLDGGCLDFEFKVRRFRAAMEGVEVTMDEKIRRLLDYLNAAVGRSEARGWKAEAGALAWLYQAAGAAGLMPERGDAGRVRAALEELARVNPRRARAIRPAFEELLRELEGVAA